MKELASQYKPQILPLQRNISLVILSHLASGKLDNLDSNASFVLNNVSTPVKFEFSNEEEANKIVVEVIKKTLDVFWGKSSTKNVKDKQLIDRLLALREQGITRKEIVERLNLHFSWRLNTQKI